MSSHTYYFAYGSNLSLTQMARRCPGHGVVGRAVARGYRLTFPRFSESWESGVANIEPHPDHAAEGVVYTLTPEDEKILDQYEAGYTKGELAVELHTGRSILVMTYFAIPCPKGPYHPEDNYLDTMLAGGQDHGLSEFWHEHVAGFLTNKQV